MTYKNLCSCVLATGIWLAVPVFVSAKGLPYSAESRNAQDSFILNVQTTERWETDRPDLGGKGIYSYGSELFSGTWGGKLTGERESQESSGVMDTQSFGSPSVDMSPSVNGHTEGVDRPFFGGGPSGGDPAVQGLSGMDGGGFSSGGGSVPGYHGR
ncbi:MAG: hypothetical protein A4E19_19925 [Nitrospira sp. SG-bin1]|nr:MAG: hypothetical protein A4E19_19925 [Nitrospira sp. SG-bin1]